MAKQEKTCAKVSYINGAFRNQSSGARAKIVDFVLEPFLRGIREAALLPLPFCPVSELPPPTGSLNTAICICHVNGFRLRKSSAFRDEATPCRSILKSMLKWHLIAYVFFDYCEPDVEILLCFALLHHQIV